ncbi:MAG: Monosaccharide transporter rane protein family [Actinomycetota bacterium]|nr:Monosaccharide transporter rane protein family [Actinomycetota bacterium]
MNTTKTRRGAAPDAPQKASAFSMVRTALSQTSGLTFAALIIMVIYFSFMEPGKFNTISNFDLLAQNLSILIVLSVGATFVIATSGIDLSIPAAVVLGEVFATKALGWFTVGEGTAVDVTDSETKLSYILVALLAALAAGLIVGVLNGVIIAYMHVPPLLATLGTLGSGLGAANLLQDGTNTGTSALSPVTSGEMIPGLSNIILIAALTVIVGWVALRLSVFGRYTLAIGSNEEAARRVGIKVERHLIKVYVLAALASSFGGFLSVSYFGTTALSGHTTDNMQAITAVALGGTSVFGGVATMLGTLMGALIPSLLKNGFIIMGVGAYWQDVAIGFVLVLTVWFDQMRRKARTKQ